jgi:hypothetical protein
VSPVIIIILVLLIIDQQVVSELGLLPVQSGFFDMTSLKYDISPLD